MILLETKEAYDAFLKDAGDKLVVIDFYAEWCGPCKMIAPKILAMESSFPDVLFAKVNVDDNEEVAMQCQINAMPTFQFMKKCNKVKEITGANESLIRKTIEEHSQAC